MSAHAAVYAERHAAATKAKTVVEDMLEVTPLNPKIATTRNDRLMTLELDCVGITSDATIEKCVEMMYESAGRKELAAKYVSISNPGGARAKGTTRDLVGELTAMGVDVRV